LLFVLKKGKEKWQEKFLHKEFFVEKFLAIFFWRNFLYWVGG